MKLVIMSRGPNLEHHWGAQARHWEYLLIVDLNSMEYLTRQNPTHALHGCVAGKLFAKVLVQNSIDDILVGSCEPPIKQTLSENSGKVLCHKKGIAYRVIEKLRQLYISATS